MVGRYDYWFFYKLCFRFCLFRSFFAAFVLRYLCLIFLSAGCSDLPFVLSLLFVACAKVVEGEGLDELLPACVASVLAGAVPTLATEIAFVDAFGGPRLRQELHAGGSRAYAWTTLQSAVAYAGSIGGDPAPDGEALNVQLEAANARPKQC